MYANLHAIAIAVASRRKYNLSDFLNIFLFISEKGKNTEIVTKALLSNNPKKKKIFDIINIIEALLLCKN